MKQREIALLSVREVAQRLNTPISTVRLWAMQGRFRGAELKQSPAGSYWTIPETALDGFEMPKRGRPAKSKATGSKGSSKVKTTKRC
jgi:hypothetical protein